MTFGESLKYHRKKKNMSQIDLAMACGYVNEFGVDTSQISKYENGMANPTWYTVKRFADILGSQFVLDML